MISSTIEAVAYDEAGAVLGVRFRNGREYRYRRVPRSVFQALLGAPSKGGYFGAHIRHAGYAYSRVA
ncbi:MAG TPA: KTSC domain-containing protein [Longimicrobium sp.]|nr:KTSC domain-containing protein [Longimicrobium sp.]